MIEFAWPYAFTLIPLPIILGFLSRKPDVAESAALILPDPADAASFQKGLTTTSSKGILRYLIPFLAWCLLITAAARPQWIGNPIEIPQSGRDLMLAVDLSGSMSTTDFDINGKTVDRLTALKHVASDFIERREGDRLGLILFGSQAYLQTPLTFDTKTVKQLLLESAVGLAGNETAIGDAIGLSVKQLRNSAESSRVLILLTDGNNNTGELTPEKASEIAANANLKVHTVAIGSNEAMVQTVFGTRRIHPSADIDEKALKAVAEKTGGHYFRAYDTKDLATIYKKIDELEPIEKESKFYRPIEEYYYYPLIAALTLIAALLIFKVKP